MMAKGFAATAALLAKLFAEGKKVFKHLYPSIFYLFS